MTTNSALVFIIGIVSLTVIAKNGIDYFRDHEAKIKSINRYEYTIKLQSGRALIFCHEDKEMEN